MTAQSGTIASPNYPNSYDHHDDCGWLITVDFGHIIDLTFTDFDVEPHSNCRYGYYKKTSLIDRPYPKIADI